MNPAKCIKSLLHLTPRPRLDEKSLSSLLSVLGLIGLILYVSNSSDLKRLQLLPVLTIVAVVLLVFALQILFGIKLCLSTALFGIRLPLTEGWMMATAGSLINIIPMTGIGFRVLYLKKRYGLAYVNSGIGLFLDMASGYLSGGAIGLLCLFLLQNGPAANAQISPLLYGLFVSYILAPCAVVIFGARLQTWLHQQTANQEGKRLNRWIRVLINLLEGGNQALQRPHILVLYLLINITINLITGLEFWFIGASLGYPVNLPAGLTLRSVNLLIAAMPLPNGTIGLREAVTALGTLGLGGTADSGVIISTTERIIATSWAVLTGGVSLLILRRKLSGATPGNDER